MTQAAARTAATNKTTATTTSATTKPGGSSAATAPSSRSSPSIHESIPRETTDDVYDKYKVEKVLGTGSMVRVRVASQEDRATGAAQPGVCFTVAVASLGADS